jgi:TPR repeat protein
MAIKDFRVRLMWRTTAAMLAAACAAISADAAFAGSFDDGLAAARSGNAAQALQLIRDAANQGDARAQFNLGEMYRQGQGVGADPAAAAGWYRKAADQGNPGAEFNLGLMSEQGVGVPRDDAKALKLLTAAAGQGYARAEIEAAAMLAAGRGGAKDTARAARLYRQAAEQGDADGEFHLGLAYLDAAQHPTAPGSSSGFRAEMDGVFGAGRWRETGGYRTQARENELRAEGALTVLVGELSSHSLGTPNAPGAYDIVVDGLSPDAAADRLRHSGMAFRRLFPEGLHGTQGPHLHVEPYLTGFASHSTPASLGGAALLNASFSVASIGDPPASPAGQTAAENYDAAATWFRRAAAQGQAGAAFNLGLMFEEGTGVPKDRSVAAHWYQTAANQGFPGASQRLAGLTGGRSGR